MPLGLPLPHRVLCTDGEHARVETKVPDALGSATSEPNTAGTSSAEDGGRAAPGRGSGRGFSPIRHAAPAAWRHRERNLKGCGRMVIQLFHNQLIDSTNRNRVCGLVPLT